MRNSETNVFKPKQHAAEGKLRILLIIYYKNKLKLQEKKTNVNAKATMFTLSISFSH